MNILDKFRPKKSKLSTTLDLATIKAPELRRYPDKKVITLTMYCAAGDYDEKMAWFRPLAKTNNAVFGYNVKNRPAAHELVFESLGKTSDEFIVQLAQLTYQKIDPEVKMKKQVILNCIDNSTPDDLDMLQTVYAVPLNDQTSLSITLNMEYQTVALTLSEQAAAVLILLLAAN